MMKTVITSSGQELTSPFDLRFGRAAHFCLYNDEKENVDFFKNTDSESSNAAGTKAAERMVEWGVSKVISGDFGPKAKELLEKFHIQMVILQEEITVGEIINQLNQNKGKV